MSVLCCRVPHLLTTLACRQSPDLTGRALALLGPDERVWAASPEAWQCGVQAQMRAEEGRAACPDLLLRVLDRAAADAAQAAMLAELAAWRLPVEPLGWGGAYVGLRGVAEDAAAVRPLAAELGRRLRRTLGADLQPAVGWDSGKFTASAAAAQAPPGCMRLVDQRDESRFLGPLSICLLPLPRPHLQQLHWLGVRTLGEFAALPAAGVAQRFGAAGRQAQRWAQGRDDRPVAAAVSAPPEPAVVPFDPPAAALHPVVEAVMASLRPLLAECAARLEGVRRLHLTWVFAGGERKTAEMLFMEPAAQPPRVEAALTQALVRLPWPSELSAVQWAILECGELLSPQLGLFPDPPPHFVSLADLAQNLSKSRCAPRLFQAVLSQANHPIPERRGGLTPLAGYVPPLG